MFKNQIEIILINGFLGSGKTTFLKHYMTSLLKKDEKVALIVNEFEDFDVDSHILDQYDIQLSMTQGCICCDLQQDLVAQIYQLVQQNVDRIVIEATGIANPIDIIMACQDSSLEGIVRYPEAICIVDSLRFLSRHTLTTQTEQLMEDQIRASQCIMINKVDQLVDDAQCQKVIEEVRKISPNCAISLTQFGEIQQSIDNGEMGQLQKVTSDHRHHAHAQYQCLKYAFENPINQDEFVKFILNLPDNILRLKGFVTFRNMPNETILVQFANQVPLFDTVGQTDKPRTIVIIGEHLDTAKLRNQLDMLQFS